MSPSRLRSRRPSGATASGQAAAISAWAGCPGACSSRARLSASMTGMPRAANMRATVDLPEPMLPVSPTSLPTSFPTSFKGRATGEMLP